MSAATFTFVRLKLLAVGVAGLLLHCSGATPELEPRVVRVPLCGEPLPERCGPVGRTFVQLPSRVGLSEEPSADAAPLDAAEAEQAVREPREVPKPRRRKRTMSDGAAKATRLWARKRWPEAAAALEPVAFGAHGDDQRIRQTAEYQIAVANLHMKNFDTATDLLLLIKEEPTHARYHEVGHWFIQLASSGECRSRRVLMSLAGRFGPLRFAALGEYRQLPHPPPYDLVDFLVARARVQVETSDDARESLARFVEGPAYRQEAQQCIDWIDAQNAAAP